MFFIPYVNAMRYIFDDWIFPMHKHNPINENINEIGVWRVYMYIVQPQLLYDMSIKN